MYNNGREFVISCDSNAALLRAAKLLAATTFPTGSPIRAYDNRELFQYLKEVSFKSYACLTIYRDKENEQWVVSGCASAYDESDEAITKINESELAPFLALEFPKETAPVAMDIVITIDEEEPAQPAKVKKPKGKTPALIGNREEWLNACFARLLVEAPSDFYAKLKDVNVHLAKLPRFACGYGKGGTRGKQDYAVTQADDGTPLVWIRPTIHTAALAAKAVVMAGVSLSFLDNHTENPDAVVNALKQLGDYPQPEVTEGKQVKQTTRLIKCVCPNTGYIVRTTLGWIERHGPPFAFLGGECNKPNSIAAFDVVTGQSQRMNVPGYSVQYGAEIPDMWSVDPLAKA